LISRSDEAVVAFDAMIRPFFSDFGEGPLEEVLVSHHRLHSDRDPQRNLVILTAM